MTEYEKRFSEAGMPIYRVEAVYLGWQDARKKPSISEAVQGAVQETAAMLEKVPELIEKIKKQPDDVEK
jgi:hypothetical protein